MLLLCAAAKGCVSDTRRAPFLHVQPLVKTLDRIGLQAGFISSRFEDASACAVAKQQTECPVPATFASGPGTAAQCLDAY